MTIAEASSLLIKYFRIDLKVAFNGVVRPGEPLHWWPM
jgi:hypothetical protein